MIGVGELAMLSLGAETSGALVLLGLIGQI
jgi:hypothetical protein